MANMEVRVPDIGDFDEVEIVEILVKPGDTVAVEDPLITLESDKASMEVPSPAAGTVGKIEVSVGDTIGQDGLILLLETEGSASEPADDSKSAAPESEAPKPAADPKPAAPETVPAATPAPAKAAPAIDEQGFDEAYASPAVRKLARELGADLARVEGTGRKGRITKDDLRSWIRQTLQAATSGGGPAAGGGIAGFEWPTMPEIDFSKFGEVETVPMTRIGKVSAKNLHRSWLHVPHVTQHEEADITEMEAFRQAQKEAASKKGVKLTPLAFLMKAVVSMLEAFPKWNSSIHPDGDKLVLKHYFHLGIAVDTPDGLVVPVIRDVDKKGLYQLAEEVVEASVKAREGKLMPKDFQGACFTISSLGGIGGTAFTPIVNAPEVGILGVSRSQTQPTWNGSDFEPRLILPLSLSYDHRVIDGAYAARSIVHLAGVLGDIRKLLL